MVSCMGTLALRTHDRERGRGYAFLQLAAAALKEDFLTRLNKAYMLFLFANSNSTEAAPAQFCLSSGVVPNRDCLPKSNCNAQFTYI